MRSLVATAIERAMKLQKVILRLLSGALPPVAATAVRKDDQWISPGKVLKRRGPHRHAARPRDTRSRTGIGDCARCRALRPCAHQLEIDPARMGRTIRSTLLFDAPVGSRGFAGRLRAAFYRSLVSVTFSHVRYVKLSSPRRPSNGSLIPSRSRREIRRVSDETWTWTPPLDASWYGRADLQPLVKVNKLVPEASLVPPVGMERALGCALGRLHASRESRSSEKPDCGSLLKPRRTA
jgi:hypothetical protein